MKHKKKISMVKPGKMTFVQQRVVLIHRVQSIPFGEYTEREVLQAISVVPNKIVVHYY
jgi:hypothetical protein